MLRLRTVLSFFGLLVALLAWGCSGDDDADQPAAAQLSTSDFQVFSSNFTEIRPRRRIPNKHTCFGEDASPHLAWSGVPPGTKSLALIAENPEDTTGLWVHWVLYNIPAEVTGLPEGIPTTTDVLPDGTVQGVNDFKRVGYGGPCPPPNILIRTQEGVTGGVQPPHSYYFRFYALDAKLGLPPGSTKTELEDAMKGHVLANAETIGKYQRRPGLDWVLPTRTPHAGTDATP